MRYAKDHRERTRRHIVETSSRALRRDGVAASSIVPLMREAGLTQGAFYNNFTGRDELLAEALVHGLAQTRVQMMAWAAAARREGHPPARRIIEEYLSSRHLDTLGDGCVMAALGAELARQSEPVRRAVYTAAMETIAVIRFELGPEHAAAARPLFMLMANAVAFARIAVTQADRDEILAEARGAALKLVGVEPSA